MAPRVSVDPSQNLDNTYDQFLRDHEKKVVPAISAFEESLHHSNVKFGRFTIPTFLKPHLITTRQSKLLHSVGDSLVRMIDRVVNLYFHESMFKDTVSLTPEAEELVRIDPGFSRTAVLVRLDAFLSGEDVLFMEFNCDSPAGMGYSDSLEKVLFEVDELKDFFNQYHFQREIRSQKLLQGLLGAYEEFGGFETPQIAIIDWKTVRTKPEFETIKSYFEEKGYKTIIADPRELAKFTQRIRFEPRATNYYIFQCRQLA